MIPRERLPSAPDSGVPANLQAFVDTGRECVY